MKVIHCSILFSCVLAALFPAGECVTKDDILKFLNSISGTNIITGQHNRNPNSDPARWTNVVKNITGKLPGMWSADFLYNHEDVQDRHIMIDEAIRQWKAGSLVSISWLACPPTQGDSCELEGGVESTILDGQWRSLLTDGDAVNLMWKRRLDSLVPHFQKMQEAGVFVIFKPFHEPNHQLGSRKYWWDSQRTGPYPTLKLFQLTRDYLDSKVDNIIWAWSVMEYGWMYVIDEYWRTSPYPTLKLFQLTRDYLDSKVDNIIWAWSVMEYGWMYVIDEYWPGADYVDVAIMDSRGELREEYYEMMLNVTEGNKPLGLGAMWSIPSPEVLEKQSRWAWFTIHAEYLKDPNHNTDEQIRETYDWTRALSQGQLNIS